VEEMRRYKHEKRQKALFFDAFFSSFINENCWEKSEASKRKGERRRRGSERPKEEIKKPTDNKQHNSDLKGDFQASLRGEMQKKSQKHVFRMKNNTEKSSGSGSQRLNNI
jgi:hypothetical protein